MMCGRSLNDQPREPVKLVKKPVPPSHLDPEREGYKRAHKTAPVYGFHVGCSKEAFVCPFCGKEFPAKTLNEYRWNGSHRFHACIPCAKAHPLNVEAGKRRKAGE